MCALSVAALAWLPGVAAAARDSLPSTCAAAGDPGFVWRSGFWLNLHNFLDRAAKQRGGIRNDAPGALAVVFEDTVGLRPLTAPERRDWDAALAFYLSSPVTRGLVDSVVQRVSERLASAADGDLRDAAIDPGLRAVLVRVAPVYRAVWWPLHDRHNRAWIASLRNALGSRGPCLARLVSSGLNAPWPAEPIVVDVSVYASWFGSYSTQHPAHITLSSNARGNQGTLGVETVFHEAGHAMTARLDSALAASAARAHRTLPGELSHLALFYTVGEAVRTTFPAHVPYADVFGLWQQNAAARRYRAMLRREWQPFLDGRRSFAAAIDGIARALPAESLNRSS